MEVSFISLPPDPFFDSNLSGLEIKIQKMPALIEEDYLVLTMNSGALSLLPLVAPLPMLGSIAAAPAAPTWPILDPPPLVIRRLLSRLLEMSLMGLATLLTLAASTP